MLAFFEQDEWTIRQIGDQPILQMSFEGNHGKWQCFAHAKEEKEQFLFYSIFLSKVPAEKRQALAEFITRANYGLMMGNFEMDYDDGEIRFKTSIDVENITLTPKIVKQYVYTNVLMMDCYLPGILSVIADEVSPKEAIARIEKR
ncbi:type III secretion system chaperone family protein [Tumidithrix elongata]